MGISFASLTKKDLAIIIVVAIVSLGAAVADIIMVVKLFEQWRAMLAAVSLTGAAGGGIYYFVRYIKKTVITS